MNHLPLLISDLALLLIVASITTLLCKKLNQPPIIGYILAGFLVGPVVNFIPTVGDMDNITLWGEIGVIFLMFTIGLEFSLHKLAKLGASCIWATALEVAGMIIVGFFVGQLLGWRIMDSIFLGGMLCVSSTMIIIKAIEDMNLKQKKFASVTVGILIIEDIVAVFLMVILSTISVSQGISGRDLAVTLGMLLFYLVIWLMVGIYIIPSFLKKTKNLMNDETLLVVSLGICFGMVWIANAIGFSSALGAFLAGSVLASTVHAERIEHLVTPCKDLFSAVFFVSVGLMVVPEMLVEYAVPIIILTLVTIIGKIIFIGLGLLIGGEDLNTIVFGASSVTQIGEFSFIIANLGITLAVTSDFLYPVIVAVSVITTFTTPYLIRFATPCEHWLKKHLPQKFLDRIDHCQAESSKRQHSDEDWRKFLKSYLTTSILYSVIIFGIIEIGSNLLSPILSNVMTNYTLTAIISCALIYLCMLPFLPPLMIFRNRYFTALWLKGYTYHLPLLALVVLRTALAIFLVMLPLQKFFQIPLLLLIIIVIPLTVLLSRSDWLVGKYLQIEAKFLSNFNERQLNEKQSGKTKKHSWLDKQLLVAEFSCPELSKAANHTLEELNWGKLFNINVIKIIRGRKHINIPQGKEKLHEDDIVIVIGLDKALENFTIMSQQNQMLSSSDKPVVSLHDYIENQEQLDETQQLYCYAVKVEKNSSLRGKNIKDAQIKSRWKCFLIGLEREMLPIVNPNPNMVLSSNDLIWVLGPHQMAGVLLKEELIHG